MTVRSKYNVLPRIRTDHIRAESDSTNGVYKCEDISEYIRNLDYPEVSIGPIGGMSGWIIVFQLEFHDNELFIYPFIFRPDKPRILFRYYFAFHKTDGSISNSLENSGYFNSEYVLHGAWMSIPELLDGYLNDELDLSVEYGVQIEGIQGSDGIWRFNFRDKIFDCLNQNNMVTLHTHYRGKHLYCHKKLFGFHCEGSQKGLVIEGKDLRHVERCLQIMHGVRLNLCTFGYHKLLYIAHHHGFPNVLHFCQYQLIRNVDFDVNIIEDTRKAIQYNSRHYLAHLLKKIDLHLNPKPDFKLIFLSLEVDMMTGEMMKMCCRYVFEKSIMDFGKFI